MAAANDAANKSLCAANAANTPLQTKYTSAVEHNIPTIGTISRIAAKPAPDDPEEVNAALALAAEEEAAGYEEGEI
jgi:hypothetical protein